MDTRIDEGVRERSRRSIRNKRCNSRRSYGEDKRPPKRLFTPEIKKFLKDWLIRRRDNPYPNRDEKKTLAIQTGLTYIQVCNWFANWRRKLKNAGKEPQRKTWTDLIKTYNSQVQGNVEHFSICSGDSIWEEPDNNNYFDRKTDITATIPVTNQDHSYIFTQKAFITTANTTTIDNEMENPLAPITNKYKSHMMEKYLRDCQGTDYDPDHISKMQDDLNKPSMISKWLESAANFKPNKNNLFYWNVQKNPKKKKTVFLSSEELRQLHGKEELDAAEALTKLANANIFKD